MLRYLGFNYVRPSPKYVDVFSEPIGLIDYDKAIEICSKEYSNNDWVKLAYLVSNKVLWHYNDDYLMGLVQKKSSSNIQPEVTGCLSCNTINFPFVSRSAKEFKFFKGKKFLTGMGFYSVELYEDVSIDDQVELIGCIAALTHKSPTPCDRFLFAITRPNSMEWQCVFVDMDVITIKLYGKKFCKMKQYYFDPVIFFSSILKGQSIVGVEHSEFKMKVRI